MSKMKDQLPDEPIEFAEPNARHTDPPTSHQAAADAAVNVNTNRFAVLSCHYRHPRGLTDYELAAITGLQQNSAGKRRGELMQKGFIEDSLTVRPAPSGSMCSVWRITPAGETAYLSIAKVEV